jgi:phospholipid/cholesterol/gamma-HCH transport system ATP-binding protein
MIRVRDLTHRFGENTVLKSISLDVEKGETLAVMGGSGGGKTTLLRCMAGLLEPTSGSVEVLGTDFYRSRESERDGLRRHIGVVFQGSALFDYMTVRDNVSFAAVRRARLTPSDVDKLVAERLDTVGLAGTEALYPSQLSGGMKKRVGVARALATDPEILFYDEPTSGLDPVTAYAIDALIREVAAKVGATSIVVTHDLNSVLRVADRVVFLEKGEVIADSEPKEFLGSTDPRIRELITKAEAEQLVEAHRREGQRPGSQ